MRQHLLEGRKEFGTALLLGDLAGNVVVEDAHAEPAAAVGHSLADAAEPQNAKPLAMNAGAQRRGPHRLPTSLLVHDAEILAKPARGTQQERERGIGGAARQHLGRVRHDQAFGLARGDIDMVEAHADRGGNPDGRRDIRKVFCRQPLPAARKHEAFGLVVATGLEQLGHRQQAVGDQRVELLLRPCDDVGRKFARNHDPSGHFVSSS